MRDFKQKNLITHGFTLIELLVVIAIIGILSTLAVIALGNTRTKARDSKRLTDLNQIGKALDLYYADQNYYPTIITPGEPLASPDGTKVYMAKIPSNPRPRNENGAPDLDYIYSTDITISNPPNKYELSTSLGTPVNAIPAGRISVGGSGGSSAPWSCGNNLVDSRDSQSYDTVQIGSQCWMKQNLNFGTMLINSYPGTNQSDADAGNVQKYCYDNIASVCSIYRGLDQWHYGGLYQWHTAMAFKQACDNHSQTSPCVPNSIHKGICPTGWHIPTLDEYQILAQFADDNHSCDLGCGSGGCCSTAGAKLKSASGWNGTDDYGFSGIASGYRDTGWTFYMNSTLVDIWTASPYSGDTYSWYSQLLNDDAGTYRVFAGRSSAHSVRCLKD